MNRLYRAKAGLTLVEMMIAMLLLSIVFLAASSLCVASQRFYLTSSNRVIISNEAQFVIQHIYKYAMKGIGDKNTPAFQITGGTQLDINISGNNPLTMDNYSTNITNYRYRYDAGAKKIYFKVGSGGEEDLTQKVNVTGVNFSKNGEALTGYITAGYNDQSLTFYFSCYPRLSSFN